VTSLLAFSFSVLAWQAWSYQGYWQLLGVFAAFAVVLAFDGGEDPLGNRSTRKG
jgi:asparagine N-glycosylation enzyme membrane subunit Stt3